MIPMLFFECDQDLHEECSAGENDLECSCQCHELEEITEAKRHEDIHAD